MDAVDIRKACAIAAALLFPLVIAAAFGWPFSRPIVPAALMLAFCVGVTFVAGRWVGLLAAVSTMLSLWFVNFPPGLSLRLADSGDISAVIAFGVVAMALVFLVDVMRERERRVAKALTDAQVDVDHQRRDVVALQRALLPATIPQLPGLVLASHYEAGGAVGGVGGDWFAYVRLSESEVGLAVGDVAGHGIGAVAHMAEYRYALRTLATETKPPGPVLDTLQRVMARYRTDGFSSVLYGVLDLVEGTWTYSNAGHPPALLVRQGCVEMLGEVHGPVIGVEPCAPYGSTTRRLKPGDVLALYTDGLIERRTDRDVDVGLARLRARIARIASNRLAEECSAIVDDVADPGRPDDVALVLARYDGPRKPRGA